MFHENNDPRLQAFRDHLTHKTHKALASEPAEEVGHAERSADKLFTEEQGRSFVEQDGTEADFVISEAVGAPSIFISPTFEGYRKSTTSKIARPLRLSYERREPVAPPPSWLINPQDPIYQRFVRLNPNFSNAANAVVTRSCSESELYQNDRLLFLYVKFTQAPQYTLFPTEMNIFRHNFGGDNQPKLETKGRILIDFGCGDSTKLRQLIEECGDGEPLAIIGVDTSREVLAQGHVVHGDKFIGIEASFTEVECFKKLNDVIQDLRKNAGYHAHITGFINGGTLGNLSPLDIERHLRYAGSIYRDPEDVFYHGIGNDEDPEEMARGYKTKETTTWIAHSIRRLTRLAHCDGFNPRAVTNATWVDQDGPLFQVRCDVDVGDQKNMGPILWRSGDGFRSLTSTRIIQSFCDYMYTSTGWNAEPMARPLNAAGNQYNVWRGKRRSAPAAASAPTPTA